jgi:hypothetical protein
LTVRSHRFVPQLELGWITGVLFERDGRLRVECPGSYADVDVLELLDGIQVRPPAGLGKTVTVAYLHFLT